MKKKSIILIIIIVIIALFLIISLNPLQYLHSNTANTAKLGNATFDLPDGYHEDKVENTNLTITDGSQYIYFMEYNDTNITDHVASYENYKLESGRVSNITDFTIDGTQIYKLTVLNESGNNQYWFVHDDKTYSIYTWTNNPKIDTIVINLVSSIH